MVDAPPRSFSFRMFERAFLRTLRRRLGMSRRAWKPLTAAILGEARRVWDGPGPTSPDAFSLGHRWSACLLVGAERVLREAGIDEVPRRRALEAGLVEPGGRLIRLFTRLMLRTSRDPFETLADYSTDQVPRRYGAGFEFVVVERREDRFVQGITRCFFHDVLHAAGEPELAPLFCAYDANWIAAIDPRRDGIIFTRPETIAGGGVQCRFEFRRTGAGNADATPARDA